MKIDVTTYRETFLREAEDRITAKKDKIEHYSSQNLHEAIMSEMNRADKETWLVEIPDDRERALKEAEERIIGHMKKNVDIGVGVSY